MSDHETTLREHGRVLADAAAVLEIADPDAGYAETAKLRRKESAACLAGADALRREMECEVVDARCDIYEQIDERHFQRCRFERGHTGICSFDAPKEVSRG